MIQCNPVWWAGLLVNYVRRAKAASVGVLCYPSSGAAFLARRWIDFVPRSHRLHYHGITGAIACRTFLLSRISGWLWHLSLLSRWRPLSFRALASSHKAALPLWCLPNFGV